jgi:hypothetical protein
MNRVFFLTVFSVCALCSVFIVPVFAMDEDARLALIDQELNCVAQKVKSGVDWNDVCYTSPERGKLDKDRLVTKSMDQMIEEHGAMAEEMEEQTQENMVTQHGEYADETKSVDDLIAEQGVLENTEETIQPAEDETPVEDSLDSSRSVQPQYTQYAKNYSENGYEPVDFTPQGNLSSPPSSLTDRLENQNRAEIGLEYNRYRYVEPIFDLVIKGNVFGAYINYTARPAKSDGIYDDIADMYKVETRFNYGRVDYKSSGSGTMDNIPDYAFEIRGLVGKDFAVMTDSRLTPYLGLGFRYLNDDASGKRTSRGAGGYERESRYVYIPMGVEFTTRLAEGWLLSPTLEYDYFINGTQISHLSDVNPTDSDSKNKQRDGYGMRGAIKFVKQNKPVDFVVEPYIRYWHIEDSDPTDEGYEPKNKTTEYGIKMGVEF